MGKPRGDVLAYQSCLAGEATCLRMLVGYVIIFQLFVQSINSALIKPSSLTELTASDSIE
jgi:hypothetical protein